MDPWAKVIAEAFKSAAYLSLLKLRCEEEIS